MKKYAIIVAGGLGSRMGTTLPKQFLLLRGKPVVWFTLTTFLEAFDDLEIVLVLPQEYMEMGKKIILSTSDPSRIITISGGDTRFHSVKNGVNQINSSSIVFVHDGIRCLVTKDLIHRCFHLAAETGNAIPSIKATDSIRFENLNGNHPVERNKVHIIQTPQTFSDQLLKRAMDQPYDNSFTDEATAVERLGTKIHLIEGEHNNIKITRAIDLVIAEKILEERENS